MRIKALPARLVILLLMLPIQPLWAQQMHDSAGVAGQPALSEELKFIDYLINNREMNDALLLLANPELFKQANAEQTDSLNYLLAWANYHNKQLDRSIAYFSKVSSSSLLYHKSRFYESFLHIYQKQFGQAAEKLHHMNPPDSMLKELKLFQQAGSSLLQRNFQQFDSLSSAFSYQHFAFSGEQKKLLAYRDKLKKIKKKSPLVAGLMSAVVPGTGKFYAGYRGQALAAMTPSLLLGAVAYENYRRAGPASAQFIVTASLFSIFYVGNIWGTVLSVKTYREQRSNEVYNNIMLDLHIPLRRVFN